jgi:phosphoserine phosphatase RsbU/P
VDSPGGPTTRSDVPTWAVAVPASGTADARPPRPDHGLAATPLHRERVAVEQLRRRLRPRQLAGIPGADIAVWHEPAGSRFGIGFYDVFSVKDDVWRLVAGDIAGRGVDTAVLAAFARDAFRTPDAGPGASLWLLDRLVRNFGALRRMTAACLDLAWHGRTATLAVASAGHPPPLLLGAGGAVRVLDPPGRPLGVGPGLRPGELRMELVPGDVVVLRAGGGRAESARDGRLADVLTSCAGRSAREVLDHVRRTLAHPRSPATEGTSFVALWIRASRRPAHLLA